MKLLYKIGVISDTHGLLRAEVLETLKGCDAILHGGDIGKPEILDKLKEIAPVYAVRGNADREWAEGLPITVDITLAGLKIYMIHNKKMIEGDIGGRNIIIYGHSHKYDEKRIFSDSKNSDKDGGGQLWLNPGSCGARRFRLPITMAVIEVEEGGPYQIKKIEFCNGTADSRKEQEGLETAYAGDRKKLVQAIMKDTDRGISVKEMADRHSVDAELAEQICRLYVTHPGIDADGIINKMG